MAPSQPQSAACRRIRMAVSCIADYSRTFGRQKFVTLRPDARAFAEAELEAELELITRLCMKRNPSKEDEAAIEKFEQDAEQEQVIVRPGTAS